MLGKMYLVPADCARRGADSFLRLFADAIIIVFALASFEEYDVARQNPERLFKTVSRRYFYATSKLQLFSGV